jgi:hypothetical protein
MVTTYRTITFLPRAGGISTFAMLDYFDGATAGVAADTAPDCWAAVSPEPLTCTISAATRKRLLALAPTPYPASGATTRLASPFAPWIAHQAQAFDVWSALYSPSPVESCTNYAPQLCNFDQTDLGNSRTVPET